MDMEQIDKTGLIRECYRIDGIDSGQCRSIFLDWLLKLPAETDPQAAIRFLLQTYGAGARDHPMTGVLNAALQAPARKGRRGGAAGRRAR